MSFDQWDWSNFSMPDDTDFCKVLRNVKDSAPGRDGIPYSGLCHPRLSEGPLPLLLADALKIFRTPSPLPPSWL